MTLGQRIVPSLIALASLAFGGTLAAQGARTAIGSSLGAAAGTSIDDAVGGRTCGIVGGVAGSVVGANVTDRPRTRVVRQHTHTREVIYVDGKPGKRTGHHEHGRLDDRDPQGAGARAARVGFVLRRSGLLRGRIAARRGRRCGGRG